MGSKRNIKDLVANAVIEYYSRFSSVHSDLIHTQEVVAYTRLIAVGEELDERKIDLLEAAAWLHDIGCPKSKEIYGNSLPVNQQNVGKEVTCEILKGISELSDKDAEWLSNVVGTHHQYKFAKEMEFIPLFEADLIVNLLSGYHEREKAPHLYDTLMSTTTGKKLFKILIG